ncbi:hypothetical protein BCV70DRAFT_60989 [Testicularia cyperi]|uniref:Zn(2)-C6 fungal-type domain-containing protein n=1 Tax=Testicularia cyperi TaxID=1882483 RepID=A0A317XYD1_9BASI|nr:hypothetical protein BCV70DRAFT_60989 [Testicularia cyperi]
MSMGDMTSSRASDSSHRPTSSHNDGRSYDASRDLPSILASAPSIQPPSSAPPAAAMQQHQQPQATAAAASSAPTHDAAAATAPKRGSNLACLKCRAIKVKCWKTNPADPRCARCNRLDLFCEFREHHRGKKLEKVIEDEGRAQFDSPEVLRRARERLALCSTFPINVELGTLLGIDDQTRPDQSRGRSVSSPDMNRGPRPTIEHALRPNDSWSQQQQQVHPHGQQMAHSQASQQAPTASGQTLPASPVQVNSLYDDVVRTNQVIWSDACYLFNLFVMHLNPVLAVLDSRLHTAQHTREHLPITFSGILAVASRFFRPDLEQQCHSVSEAILDLAQAQKVCSLDHVLALILRLLWGDLSVVGSPKILVRAIGCAYELGLPLCFDVSVAAPSGNPTLPLHSSYASLETIELRTQQRTWMQLCLLELSQQANSAKAWQQPQLIATADIPNPRVWHQANASTVSPADTRLAYLLDLAIGQSGYNRLSEALSGTELRQSVQTLESRDRALTTAWFDSYGEEQVPRNALDRYSRLELGFLHPFSRFARALQVWTCAVRLARTASDGGSYQQASHIPGQAPMVASSDGHMYGADSTAAYLEHVWLGATADLALKVLDAFVGRVMEQELLRFSSQYMALGCFGAARWMLSQQMRLHPSITDRAKDSIGKVIRLLARPQYYPDGSRIAMAREMGGLLDKSLRSLMGDARGTSPKRTRGQAFGHLPAVYRNSDGTGVVPFGVVAGASSIDGKKRRMSAASGMVLGDGSAGRSDTTGSERGSEWSPHVVQDSRTSYAPEEFGKLSIDVNAGYDQQWNPLGTLAPYDMTPTSDTGPEPSPFSLSAPDLHHPSLVSATYAAHQHGLGHVQGSHVLVGPAAHGPTGGLTMSQFHGLISSQPAWQTSVPAPNTSGATSTLAHTGNSNAGSGSEHHRQQQQQQQSSQMGYPSDAPLSLSQLPVQTHVQTSVYSPGDLPSQGSSYADSLRPMSSSSSVNPFDAIQSQPQQLRPSDASPPYDNHPYQTVPSRRLSQPILQHQQQPVQDLQTVSQVGTRWPAPPSHTYPSSSGTGSGQDHRHQHHHHQQQQQHTLASDLQGYLGQLDGSMVDWQQGVSGTRFDGQQQQ